MTGLGDDDGHIFEDLEEIASNEAIGNAVRDSSK